MPPRWPRQPLWGHIAPHPAGPRQHVPSPLHPATPATTQCARWLRVPPIRTAPAAGGHAHAPPRHATNPAGHAAAGADPIAATAAAAHLIGASTAAAPIAPTTTAPVRPKAPARSRHGRLLRLLRMLLLLRGCAIKAIARRRPAPPF